MTPKYTLVGECYIHGIMDGEIVKPVEQEDSPLPIWLDIEPHRLNINIESSQVLQKIAEPEAFPDIPPIVRYPEPQGPKRKLSSPLLTRTKAPINFTKQSAIASTKPEFDIFPNQFRLYWTCVSFETLLKMRHIDSK